MLNNTVKRKRRRNYFLPRILPRRIPLQKAQRSIGTFSRILDSPWSAPTCLSFFAHQSMAGLFPMGFSRYGGSFKREQSKFQGKDLEIYFPSSLWSTDASFQNRILPSLPSLLSSSFDLWRKKGLPDQATVWNHYRWTWFS